MNVKPGILVKTTQSYCHFWNILNIHQRMRKTKKTNLILQKNANHLCWILLAVRIDRPSISLRKDWSWSHFTSWSRLHNTIIPDKVAELDRLPRAVPWIDYNQAWYRNSTTFLQIKVFDLSILRLLIENFPVFSAIVAHLQPTFLLLLCKCKTSIRARLTIHYWWKWSMTSAVTHSCHGWFILEMYASCQRDSWDYVNGVRWLLTTTIVATCSSLKFTADTAGWTTVPYIEHKEFEMHRRINARPWRCPSPQK